MRLILAVLVGALESAEAFLREKRAHIQPDAWLEAEERGKVIRHALTLGRRYLGEEAPPPEIDPETLAAARDALCPPSS